MNKRENLIRRIKDTLAIYAVRIDLDKGEASREAENFYCELLNILKGYQLQNMNLVKPNYPAIDLGDAGEGIGIQVTSSATRKKVQDTLDAMFRNGVEQEYPHLVMLITNKWVESRKAFRMDGVCQFDPNGDIWDTDWLLAQIDRVTELEKLREIHDYLREHLHLVREPVPALNLPLQSGMAAKNFVGREKELRELAQRFEKDQIVVLSGLGGMGKTELAVRFGREYEESGRGWAYFLHFSGSFSATVRSNVTGIIPGYSPEGKPEELIVADALAALNRCGKGDLLILDNADEGSITALRRELSKLPMRVLVTSRKAVPGAVRVEPLSNDALYAVFELNDVNISKEEMDALIGAVNAHTLTVDVMARTMGRGRRSATPEKMLAALKERDLSRGFTKVEIDYAGSPDQARINEHLKAVFRVAELAEEAQKLLRCATLLPEGGMDDELFLAPFAEEDGDWLDDLIEGGWLYMKDGLLCIHPVIRIVCVEELKPTDGNCLVFLSGIKIQYDRKQYEHSKFSQMAELFEKASSILEDEIGFWANAAGYFWGQVAEHQRALTCNLRYVEKMETYRSDSNYRAIGYNNVGSTYGTLGDHKQALEYQLKALAIWERVLPPENPDLATSYNNVGMTYGALGDHGKALEYNLKALGIRERVLPPEHPDLAQSYNNVGITYGAQGDHEKALEYKLKALAIRERVLPPDHPDLATSYNNVGGSYLAMGDHEKALEYVMKAHRIRERVLPGNHPDLAMSFNNIAMTYYDLGRVGEAATHMRRAAEIINRSPLSETHPNRVNVNKWADRLEQEARQEETV